MHVSNRHKSLFNEGIPGSPKVIHLEPWLPALLGVWGIVEGSWAWYTPNLELEPLTNEGRNLPLAFFWLDLRTLTFWVSI